MNVERIAIADRQSWLALRLQDVTASDIGAICGVDPRRSPLRVYAEKTGMSPPTEENAVMRRGRWLEAAIKSALSDERPAWDVRKADVYLRCSADRIGATPDFVATDPERDGVGIIQGKIVARPVWNEKWIADGTITAPLGYQLQTLTEGMLAGAAWAELAVLVIDTFTAELHIVPVDLHDGAWQRVRGTVAAFWADVQAGRQPHVSPEIDGELLRAIYRQDDGNTIDLSGDNELPELLDEREVVKGRIKADTARAVEIETVIRGKLGPASFGIVRGWRVKCAVEPRAAHSVAASAPRVLRIKRGL